VDRGSRHPSASDDGLRSALCHILRAKSHGSHGSHPPFKVDRSPWPSRAPAAFCQIDIKTLIRDLRQMEIGERPQITTMSSWVERLHACAQQAEQRSDPWNGPRTSPTCQCNEHKYCFPARSSRRPKYHRERQASRKNHAFDGMGRTQIKKAHARRFQGHHHPRLGSSRSGAGPFTNSQDG
jgi:hypothetical protein